tara:strand:- start:39 stop:911 length:873 start_codon:yes stop_codon:yes gene_type:complete
MNRYRPYFFLILTIILWGSSFPLITDLIIIFKPTELALSRFFVPAIFSFIYIVISKLVVERKDILKFFLASFFGIFSFAFFINLGQQSMSAGAGSFIVNINPLITSLIGYYFLKQDIKKYFWVGIIFCTIGIFIISLENYKKYSFDIGFIYLLIAAFSISLYFHLIKPLVNKYGALLTFNYTLFIGSIPMFFYIDDTLRIIYNADLEIQLSILWLSFFSTLIPYYTWTYSVGYFGASKASFFLFLIPIVAMIIDFIIYTKFPSIFTIIGGFLIIISVSSILYFNSKKYYN